MKPRFIRTTWADLPQGVRDLFIDGYRHRSRGWWRVGCSQVLYAVNRRHEWYRTRETHR